MVRIALQFKATLENVASIVADGDDFRWFIKLKCSACGEVRDHWQYVTASEQYDIDGSRGVANLVEKCKLCGRQNTLSIEKGAQVAAYTDDDDGNFKTLVTFECRGIEPIAFQARNGFTIRALNSKTEFSDVDLCESEWYDVDEESAKSVCVTELESRFVKV